MKIHLTISFQPEKFLLCGSIACNCIVVYYCCKRKKMVIEDYKLSPIAVVLLVKFLKKVFYEKRKYLHFSALQKK